MLKYFEKILFIPVLEEHANTVITDHDFFPILQNFTV